MEIMRTYHVQAFGIARDILGGRVTDIAMTGNTVADLRQTLLNKYPQLKGLRSLYIAVNSAYADDTSALQPGDEIALIPPVSGG